MSRRNAAPKRDILSDPVFGDKTITKLINCVMVDGKKSIAEKIVHKAFLYVLQKQKDKSQEGDDSEGGSGGGVVSAVQLSSQSKERIVKLFLKALDNVSPAVEVKSRRVGGSNYQVPVEVRPERRITLGMRWLIKHANNRSEKTMELRLANEILDALRGTGGASKERERVHKMAQANQAFAHYRW